MKQWFGADKNNHIISECTSSWTEAKDLLKSLSFDNNGQIIELPKNVKYVQGKTASASLFGGKSTIESRFLGFYKNELKILVRIDEKTNSIKIEVIEA